MEKITRIEGKRILQQPPSVTHGFNAGLSHMYSNPVEREAIEDAKLIKASVDDRMAKIHRMIFGK